MTNKRTKRASTTDAPIPTAGEPRGLVAAMQQFFQLHGYYRAEDVNRVLGDPRETVELGNKNALPGLARTEP